MSPLAKWLKENGLTHAKFAARIGKHKTTVSRIVNGEVPVDRDTARRIFSETGGAITPNHLYGIPPVSGPSPAADEPVAAQEAG